MLKDYLNIIAILFQNVLFPNGKYLEIQRQMNNKF